VNASGDPAPERVAETGSTNDDLLARVRAAAALGATAFAPCLLVADRQRAGRGRHGRHWHATPAASPSLTRIFDAAVSVLISTPASSAAAAMSRSSRHSP